MAEPTIPAWPATQMRFPFRERKRHPLATNLALGLAPANQLTSAGFMVLIAFLSGVEHTSNLGVT
jgi:hypothetical protein